MHTYTQSEFLQKKNAFLQKIKKGAVFIYPTDTIYGIGCDATNKVSVQKIQELKGRFSKPFSVIAPQKEWIEKNCEVTEKQKPWLEKIPGPYTLIVTLKNKKAVVGKVNNHKETLGVRMPNHWFFEVVEELGIPIVTTSVNKAGEEFMTSLNNLDETIKNHVDFIIYEDKKEGKPSTLIDREGMVISR